MVGTDAQKAFTGHHQVTPEVAISEIRLVADKALRRGGYRRYASGFHRLEAEKHMMRISPDGSIVTRYASRHYEWPQARCSLASHLGSVARRPATVNPAPHCRLRS
jgi:hypothetical protein